MDYTIKPTNSTVELTPSRAQDIYDLIVLHGNVSRAYSLKGNSDFEPEHFPIVDKEADKIIAEIQSKLNGSFLLEAKIPAIYDEEGEIIDEEVPAVYYVVTTETKLKASLDSELLDTDKVYNDFKGSRTFTQLKGE